MIVFTVCLAEEIKGKIIECLLIQYLLLQVLMRTSPNECSSLTIPIVTIIHSSLLWADGVCGRPHEY